ncbi:MAG TPA: hypothetical protein PLX08_04640 [Bacteroidales bacterium]|nr:hypothetical protein [Bacteroidales bacterium]
MPSNLNALIRYKTINSCLYGGRRKWSLEELIERCSDALSEYRGRKSSVSERTIRDDIRVMRSEILGFNAPIRQKDGLYWYEDPYYSILSVSLTDSGLLEKILEMLVRIRPEVNHPELEILIEKLSGLADMKSNGEIRERIPDYRSRDLSKRILHTPDDAVITSLPTGLIRETMEKVEEKAFQLQRFRVVLCWGDVLGLIISG